MLKMITYPNPILNKKSQPVANFSDPKIRKLVKNMIPTMLKADGVGLAAPQIGQNIRLTIINHKDKILVVFNPKIIKKSILKQWGEEGCLSVPGKYGEVKRHKSVVVKYQDEAGQEKIIKTQGLLARIFQHEIDHLDGVLFISKARNLKEYKSR